MIWKFQPFLLPLFLPMPHIPLLKHPMRVVTEIGNGSSHTKWYTRSCFFYTLWSYRSKNEGSVPGFCLVWFIVCFLYCFLSFFLSSAVEVGSRHNCGIGTSSSLSQISVLSHCRAEPITTQDHLNKEAGI